MKFDLKKELFLLILSLIPIMYLFYVWQLLPAEVPIHYNFEGTADRFSNKMGFAAVIIGMVIFNYLLLLALPFIDPKKNIQQMGKKFFQVKLILVLLVTALSLFMIYKTIYVETPIQFMMVILGGFFIGLGNYFQTIKQNYFMGIRTPWTLNDESNWRKTHKISGKIWMIGGLLLIIFYFVFPLNISTVLNLIIVGIMALVPMAYSFYFFKKEELK